MYFIDSSPRTVTAFDYDVATGSATNPRVVIQTPEKMGYPDGMTIDVEDKLWIAHWQGSCVARWDPTNGSLLSTIQLPVSKVSSCAFGGANLTDLYITSASIGTDVKQEPLAGSLFIVRNVGIRGVPANEFVELPRSSL